MRTKLTSTIGWTATALLLAAAMTWLGGATTLAAEGDITGAVSGPNGPEAGVWVIAETDDLETHFIKIVVTDDEGRFLLPELPDAGYRVWVRGYGLKDSTAVEAEPGADLTLRAAAPATLVREPESTSREVLTDAELRRAHDNNLRAALDETGWKIYGPGGTAELLGMKPTTLTARIKKAGLRRPNRLEPEA